MLKKSNPELIRTKLQLFLTQKLKILQLKENRTATFLQIIDIIEHLIGIKESNDEIAANFERFPYPALRNEFQKSFYSICP